MIHSLALDEDLREELKPSEEIEGLGFVSPSIFDQPEGIIAQEDEGGALELRFRYCDEEPANPPEIMGTAADGPLTLARGKHSGKILYLRVPSESDRTPVSADALAERLNRLGANLKRINQRLNFRMIANILNHHGQELVPAN